MSAGDWRSWHRQYDDDGPLAARLAIVRRHIGAFLDSRAGRPVAVVSMCSGDGRDLLGVLAERPARRDDVSGRLVELDPQLAAAARRRIRDASAQGLEVLVGDAGLSTAYSGAVPADLLLVCGVFGNIPDADVKRTVGALPMLCAPDAVVIWTRHRRPPDLTPSLRRWFGEAGFVELAFETVPDSPASVGVGRYQGPTQPFEPGVRLFSFVPRAPGAP
jgi:hypothetical protein